MPMNVTVDEARALSQLANPNTGLPYISQDELVAFLTLKAMEIKNAAAPYIKPANSNVEPSVKLM